MKVKVTKSLSLFLVLMVLCSGLFGCAGNVKAPEDGTTAQSADSATTQEVPKEPIVLTQFTTTLPEIDPITGGDFGNTPFQKELSTRTGVKIKWILATAEDAQQKLQLLISSKDVPNIFSDGSFRDTYPGGPSKAAADGIIVKLNPYLDTLAKDYKKVFTSNPEYEKNLKADNGDIYGFSCFRGGKESTVFFGPMVRKDLLDKASVPVPETIEEWHTALVALKNQGCKAPLSMLDWFLSYCGGFVGAYGVCQSYYAGQDSKIHYGPEEEGYKKFLELFNAWFKEGLIDPDLTVMKEQTVLDTKILDGKTGASLNWIGRIKRYNDEGRKTDPNFNMVATLYPVLNKGDQPLYGQADTPVIQSYFVGATDEKNIENTIKWYNYGYTEEGQMLYNFGIEGESYTMVDGRPTYTDEMFKNSKGWTESQAKIMYAPITGDAPSLENLAFFEQLSLATDEQKAAAKTWSDTKISSLLPNLSYTDAEQIVMKKDGDVLTYMQEQTAKFILGEQPITKWDEYVKGLKSLGIDELVAAYDAAYERYKAR